MSPSFNANNIFNKHLYTGQEWELELSLIEKNDKKVQRSRGFTSQPIRFINNFKPLYTALNDKKPAKYDIKDNPYIICVGVDDLTANEYEFSEVLFGPNNMDSINLSYSNNGFFYNECKPVNTNVSAVVFCKSLKQFGLMQTQITIWHNPFALNPLKDCVLPFHEFIYTQENIYLHRKRISKPSNVFQLLNVPDEEYLKLMDFKYRKSPESE